MKADPRRAVLFLFVTLLLASASSAQPVVAQRDQLFLIHAEWGPAFQELVDIVRTMANLQQVSIDYEAKTLHVIGDVREIGIADWLLAWLDRPPIPKPRNPISRTDHSDVVRILYLTQEGMPQFTLETFNVIRSMADLQRVLICNAHSAIVLRGRPDQALLAEWLVDALDTPGKNSVARLYEGETVRVFYVAHANSRSALEALATRVRSTAKVLACFVSRAIAVRGTASQIALAERLIRAHDR